MDKSLYVAMTGARETQLSLSVHSNNLANANTLGFKTFINEAITQSLSSDHGFDTRSYAMGANPGIDFSQGVMQETGNPLDVAIKGDGFFVVQTDDLRQVMTRAGAMKLTPDGQLTDFRGNAVVGVDGPIDIPPYERLTIGEDGTITIQPAGANPNEAQIVGQIMLVNPDKNGVMRTNDGYFEHVDGLPNVDDTLSVVSGMVEGSNTNVVAEFTRILSLSRQYELTVKMMKESRDQSQKAAQLLQLR